MQVDLGEPERICSTAHPPITGGRAVRVGALWYSDLVESIATIISMMNGTLISRVVRPLIRS
jgi:hypothetical protein